MKYLTNTLHNSKALQRHFLLLTCLFAFMLATIYAGHSLVAAQGASTLTTQSALAVSPAIIEQALDPGKPAKFTVQVNNITDTAVPVKGTVRGFTVQADKLEKTDQVRLDASQWFAFDEPDFILQPKQVRIVKGTILPPTNATPGGHYATLYFQPLLSQSVVNPSTMSLSAKVGVLAMLIVKGDIDQAAQYKNQLATSSLIRHGPADFSFSVQNTGNVHLLPTGKLVIYDWRGRVAAKIDLPIGILLPQSVKEYKLEWKAPHAHGRYRATLEVTYGTGNTQLPETSVTLWIIPWVEIIVASLCTGLVAWFVITTRRRWQKAWRTWRST